MEVSPSRAEGEKEDVTNTFHEDDIINIILKKFNTKKKNKNTTESFFTQQIHIKPPEGLTIGANSSLAPN
jgi:hypothetical protein